MTSRCSGRHCSSPYRFVRQPSQQRQNIIVQNLIRRKSTLVYILCYSMSISRVRPLSVDTSLNFGSYTRRSAIGTSVATCLGGGSAKAIASPLKTKDVVKVATGGGLRYKRLGGSDIIVSEVGIGTQRWGGTDFNAPDEYLCHAFMDRAVFDWGVNLIDTAEQYPIPSNNVDKPEGSTEKIIGSWLRKGAGRREKVVIASKITGGRHVTPRTIREDCEASLRRLGTDYLDVYNLHWPARYTPQSNWGQSLNYDFEQENSMYYKDPTSFAAIASVMGKLVKEGKIRGWGMCNDNCYGMVASCAAADKLEVERPCVMQNDFSLLDRRIEENGVAEAGSSSNENVGFMAYNVLAGGILTGKYFSGSPPSVDNPDRASAEVTLGSPRGRMDTVGWGATLYRYRSQPALAAAREYAALAKRFGLSLTELSLRWSRERRAVTTSLIGTTSMSQLDEDLSYFSKKEPLPKELLWEIDRVHMKNRLPIFSSTDVGADWGGEGEIGERIP